MKNQYIELPSEVKEKIETDSQNESKALLESIREYDTHLKINALIDAYSKLYKKDKGTEWFLKEKHRLELEEKAEQSHELLGLQESIINELHEQIGMFKDQIETFKMKVK